MLNITNEDNMALMARYKDNHFDLAIVDPPYGIGKKLLKGGKNGTVKFHEQYEKNEWDNSIPPKEYFDELFRVSNNQIVWGANYFIQFLKNSRGIICWDKKLGKPYNFSHFELGWTSFDCIARKIDISSNTGGRIHPTQKPVKLYEWLLDNYAKEGDKILDTHLGSGSIAIACHNRGFELTACELDKEYYEKAMERIKNHTAQQRLF